MRANATLAPMGHVQIEKRKRDGTVTQRLSFDNLFLMSGYRSLVRDLAGLSPTNFDAQRKRFHLFLGTGTSEPSMYDTGLTGRSEKKINSDAIALSGYHYDEIGNGVVVTAFRHIYNYGEGEAEGVWTEVGIADENYQHPLTRALIRDEHGNPVSITVLSDEFLSVSYEMKIAISKPVIIGGININGDEYSAKVGVRPRSARRSESYGGRVWVDGFGVGSVINLIDISSQEISIDEETGVVGGLSSDTTIYGLDVSIDNDEFGVHVEGVIDPGDDVVVRSIVFGNFSNKQIAVTLNDSFTKSSDDRLTINLHLRFEPEGYDSALDPGA